MKDFKFLILFLIINFGGLALGSWLNKAPWTPPGWFFGVAWTSIMICFSIYLVSLFKHHSTKYLIALYIFQVGLNVSWNYVFFNQHLVGLGLVLIVLLLFVIIYFFISYRFEAMEKIRYLLLPYLLWLCIASSLNAYVILYN